MKTQLASSGSRRRRPIVATLMLVLALTIISATASAGAVTFSYNTSCQICDPPPDLSTAQQIGQTTVESGVTIDMVASGANSLGLTGGQLTFVSAPATFAFYDPPFSFGAFYDAAGGSGAINATGFTSPLLNILTFLPGGSSEQENKPGGIIEFDSPFEGTINPAVLTALGLDPAFTHGYGTISDSISYDLLGQGWDTNVTVTFTSAPEPGSLALFGSGVLALGRVLRKRLRRLG
jgi:PEP-CTERM motif